MQRVRRFLALIAIAAAAPAFAQEQPDWAGPGTPLSAWALQPAQADPRNPPRTVTVARGQTLYDIATLYQIPMLALIEVNGLEPPYAAPPGSVLRLPRPHVHVVRAGESFEDIARAYDIDPHSLAAFNRMRPPYSVAPGDRVVLPAGIGEAAGDSDEQAPPPPAALASMAPETPSATVRFAWPLRGAIVARYGVQPNGARLDGIEIAGHEGDAIAAAADGDVVYAGSDLAAYGTLVLVRHAGNYVTAYGFARRALVREGDHVRAGQRIAELGARSDGRARLLFQVRQGAHAVDPAPLLGIAAN